MIRFDDLTREEQYFSATILPHLLVMNDFAGLSAFENLLINKGVLEARSIIDSDIQIVSEPFLERDLSYYKIDIQPSAFRNKMGAQPKPDLMILTSVSIYLFECKVFTNDSEYKLYEQIKKQKYLFDVIEGVTNHKFQNKLHLLLLPYDYTVTDTLVITWKEVYGELLKVTPSKDYFLQKLEKMISRV